MGSPRLITYVRGWWSGLSIRYKLLFGFHSSFLLIMLLSLTVIYLVVLDSVKKNTERELQGGTTAIFDLVRSGTDCAIRNYLRAVAEKNLDIVRMLHEMARRGVITEAEAQEQARTLLLSQKIGSTGYIFVWDARKAPSSVILVVHPKIQGSDVDWVDFVQEGVRKKTGYMEYSWRNPGEAGPRKKAMYLASFEPWKWIIAVSSYRSEFIDLVRADDFRKQILSMKFGRTGYSFILDLKGDMILHPYLSGNVWGLRDSEGRMLIREICQKRRGRLSYAWLDPGTKTPRQKIVVFNCIDELGWILCSSGYVDELYAPVWYAQRVIALTFFISLALLVPFSFWLSRGLARPILKLVERLRSGIGQEGVADAAVGGDEIQIAAAFFDGFIRRLDQANRALQEENLAQRVAREEIWKLSQFQESVIESASVWICVMDESGEVVIWNHAAEELSGYSREEAIGSGWIWKMLAPLGADSAMDFTGDLSSGQHDLESTVKTKAGAERRIRWFIRALRDPLGASMGTIVLGVDLTKQARALGELSRAQEELMNVNRKLIEEKERLATTLWSIGDGVITLSRNGEVESVNRTAERITGWPATDAEGKLLCEVFPLCDRKTGRPVLEELLEAIWGGSRVEIERDVILATREGGRTNVAVAASPILDEIGEIAGGVLVIRDVSERIRLEQEMLKRSKIESLGVFAGGIAHDFNNLLAGVIGNISLVKEEVPADGQMRTLLADAESICMRARGLTQQLLTFSHGGVPIKKSLSLGKVILETATFVLSGSTVRPEFSLEEGLWNAEVDEGQFAQVIHNLILNARQAMPRGGSIFIGARNEELGEAGELPPGRYVLITIADQGVGIPAENLTNIFDPYFTTKETGNGLGLAVSYSIIRNHGGLIGVHSVQGEGTTIEIRLPASEAKVVSVADERPRMQGRDGGRVLVMDDEAYILDVAERMLSRLGYEVVRARNGEEAVELYRESARAGLRIDLLIMDLTIPGGAGGREVAEVLSREFGRVHMIVSSGYSDDPIMASYRDYGFCGVLIKPYRYEDLSQAVRTAMQE